MNQRITHIEAQKYNAIQNACAELFRQDDPELIALGQAIQEYLRAIRGPLTRQRAITRALMAIDCHPRAVELLRQYDHLSKSEEMEDLLRGEKGVPQPAGSGDAIRPGPLLVCPIPGCLYQQYQMEKGEEYFCKYHPGQKLIRKPTTRRRR